LQVIEACIYSDKLFSILRKIGYDIGILEDAKEGLSRKTIVTNDIKLLSNLLRSRTGFKGIIVVKPMSLQVLRYSIISKKVNMVQFDNENIYLLKRTMINLLKIYDKFIEINLNNISSLNLIKIIGNSKINKNIILSSCAREYYELWPPLSKLNFVTIHGIPEELGLQWVFLNPIRLIISASRDT